MGHIKIRFFAKGINLENDPTSVKWGKVQSLQREYSTSKMQEIEVINGDFYFDFDIDQISGIIDWENLNYPDENIKGKIFEIIYYGEKSKNLEKILEDIEKCNGGYELEALGQKAINIIKDVVDSRFFPSLKLWQASTIGNIEYTNNKEIRRANRHSSSSNKRKNEALRDAKDKLAWDINEFKSRLDNFDTNE